MVVFSRVRAADAAAAYQWFVRFARGNDAIFYRDQSWFMKTISDGAVWWARSEYGEILGLVYTFLDRPERAWEVGGLMVAPSAAKRGIGSALMRFALAHMLFEHDPLDHDPPLRIISHVHRDNDDPRRIMENLRFEWAREVRKKAEELPGLRAAQDGYVYGDEFELVMPEGLRCLGDWTYRWNQRLSDGTPARIETSREGVDYMTWGRALREMADRLSANEAAPKAPC